MLWHHNRYSHTWSWLWQSDYSSCRMWLFHRYFACWQNPKGSFSNLKCVLSETLSGGGLSCRITFSFVLHLFSWCWSWQFSPASTRSPSDARLSCHPTTLAFIKAYRLKGDTVCLHSLDLWFLFACWSYGIFVVLILRIVALPSTPPAADADFINAFDNCWQASCNLLWS